MGCRRQKAGHGTASPAIRRGGCNYGMQRVGVQLNDSTCTVLARGPRRPPCCAVVCWCIASLALGCCPPPSSHLTSHPSAHSSYCRPSSFRPLSCILTPSYLFPPLIPQIAILQTKPPRGPPPGPFFASILVNLRLREPDQLTPPEPALSSYEDSSAPHRQLGPGAFSSLWPNQVPSGWWRWISRIPWIRHTVPFGPKFPKKSNQKSP